MANPYLLKKTKNSFSYDESKKKPHLLEPNSTGQSFDMGNARWIYSDPDLLLKNISTGTTILTINLTTGNITLGGTGKQITCTKIVGA